MQERDRLIVRECKQLAALGEAHKACKYEGAYHNIELQIVATAEALLRLIKESEPC